MKENPNQKKILKRKLKLFKQMVYKKLKEICGNTKTNQRQNIMVEPIGVNRNKTKTKAIKVREAKKQLEKIHRTTSVTE